MIDTIYYERSAAGHPRTKAILARFPHAVRISCDRYGEVFNRRAQSFRLQKQRPSLILAQKHANLVLETPVGYGIGGERNYYFSHMLNCVYDCRYCFLQGMYQSAHYVLFVNYEDFGNAILEKAMASTHEEPYFFSGYDCDSLALDNVTEFTDFIVPLFRKLDNAWLELRTKSVQTRALESYQPQDRVIVAFSITPNDISEATEHKVPKLTQRLAVMQSLAQCGWQLGLRFDPLLYFHNWQTAYRELFSQIFAKIRPKCVHSVSLESAVAPGVHRVAPTADVVVAVVCCCFSSCQVNVHACAKVQHLKEIFCASSSPFLSEVSLDLMAGSSSLQEIQPELASDRTTLQKFF